MKHSVYKGLCPVLGLLILVATGVAAGTANAQNGSFDRAHAAWTKILESSIFKWFSADFEKSAGSVESFVRRYLKLEPGQQYEIEYLDYDWSLNGR